MSSVDSTIGEITQESLVAHVDKWKAIACSHAVIDRDKIAESIKQLYANLKTKPPAHLIFVPSPYIGAIAAAIVVRSSISNPELSFVKADFELIRQFKETITGNIWRTIASNAPAKPWRQIESYIEREIARAYGGLHGQFVNAFRLAGLGLQNPSVGMRFDFYESTGGIVSYLSKILERDLPAKYYEQLDVVASQYLSGMLVSSATSQAWRCSLGCHDASMPFFDLVRQAGFAVPELDGILTISQNCGWWWPLGDICIITERPLYIRLDEEARLHNSEGRAFEYQDTWGGYAWHGEFIPERFIAFTQNMKVSSIINEPNSELRRRMLELFGPENFLLASGAQPVQADECGVLYRMELSDDEPLVMVAVTNSSPEPDGHHKRYFLRVPPTMQTAREAIAWTFDLPASKYSPEVET